MKKMLLFVAFLSMLLVGGKNSDWSTLTIINKSEMPIAVQLNGVPEVCINSYSVEQEEFYYLPVAEGSRETPVTKTYTIAKDKYNMQLFYIETWDPVYGFKCNQPAPNLLNSTNDLRVVVLPCKEAPKHPGEPTMRKFVPGPIGGAPYRYFQTRYIY